jgi:glycosyltransferase involved in cell wall biosynthesis
MPDRQLRILYHHRIAASDGMRVHIEEIVNALRARGHIVKVVGPGQRTGKTSLPDHRLERIADITRKILPGSLFELMELIYNIPAWRRLSREAAQFRPDILYERYNLYLLAGLYLKRRRRLPMILEVNAPLAAERARFGKLRLRALARACEGALWRHSDAVLPVTAVLAEHVRARRGTAAGIHVMANGAEAGSEPDAQAVMEIRRRFGLCEQHIVLGFTGFIRAWHGVGWALDALPNLPAHVHLVIVGDGPARVQLENKARMLGLADRVHFAGRVARRDIPAYVRLFDIALQTASLAYASPLKLFEYMAQGRAIVAPDQANIREILQDGENALLFSPDDRASFETALTSLCHDTGLRIRLGAAARRTIDDRSLTWAHNAARIEALARQLSSASAALVPMAEIPFSSVAENR